MITDPSFFTLSNIISKRSVPIPDIGGSDLYFSKDSTLKNLQLIGTTLIPAFSADNHYYTALVVHTVHSATVTATSNDAGAAVNIFSGVRGTTKRTARKGPKVSLEEGYNIIAIDITAENRTAQSTYIIEVTKFEAPPVLGGPLPVFQSASVGNKPTGSTASSSSSASFGEWKSRLIFAETLLDGGVRFVFFVPAEEFQMEETVELLSGNWRPLAEDEFQSTRESLGSGQYRLTVLLPKAEGKQRFLRLTPKTRSEESLERDFLPREAILFPFFFALFGGCRQEWRRIKERD